MKLAITAAWLLGMVAAASAKDLTVTLSDAQQNELRAAPALMALCVGDVVVYGAGGNCQAVGKTLREIAALIEAARASDGSVPRQ